MSPTNMSEEGLESLIVASLTDAGNLETSGGYVPGDSKDFDCDYAVDLAKLLSFLGATQPKAFEQLGLGVAGPRRQQFLNRLQGEITRKGVIEILRSGIPHGPAEVDLFYGTPSPGNPKATELSRPISSALRVNCITARTNPSSPLTCACSSTACP